MSGPSVLFDGRRLAELMMTDMCTVTAPDGEPELNTSTQQYEQPMRTVYYGPCQVQSGTAMSSPRALGDSFTLINRVTIKVPISAFGFASGQTVVIDAAEDMQLVGARFTVRSVGDKSHATCRRLEVEEA